jgi:hypothetical protein
MAAAALMKRLTGEPVSKVEIHISCDKLLNKDVTSKSDPCCLLYMMNNSQWYEVGRTETIKNCLNPQFSKAFEVDYYFEEVQRLRFAIYDIDNTTPQVSDDDFLGQIECTLGEIVSGSPFTRQLMLRGNTRAGNGTITLHALETGHFNEILQLSFRAQGLDNKDFMGKSDPYLEFSRRMPDGAYQVIHRTEVVKNDLNPRWRTFDIKASRLSGSDLSSPIKVECYDYDSDGTHDLIGSFATSVTELMQGTSKKLQWPCINPKKAAKKKNYQNSGIVHLESCRVTKAFSFLDYIFGGLQINFTVGIDFTASNGNPMQRSSLHFMDPYQPNAYMKAIQAVGVVIQDYDSDQMYPVLGYGAKIPPQMEVSHCFALNFNAANPFCTGIQGILDAYRMCISHIVLHGPTNFSPIILHAAQFAAVAKQESSAKNYFVLLIITDGVISDMTDTIRAIVYASTLPFSIIIVGVGSADFSAMDALDCDTGMLRDNQGHVAQRDIVQFVPFRNFENGPPAALAKQVLAEVPDQVCRYYQMNNIAPGVRPPAAVAPQQQQPLPSNPAGSYPQQHPVPAPRGQNVYPSAGQVHN